MENMNLLISKAKKIVNRWHGSDAIILELTRSHRTLIIVCGLEFGKNLVIACLGPEYICGPMQWSNSDIRIETVKLNSGNDGIAVIDESNAVRITADSFEIRENVKIKGAGIFPQKS